VLVASLSTYTYAGDSGNPKILKNLENHDVAVQDNQATINKNILEHADKVNTNFDIIEDTLGKILTAVKTYAPVAKTGQTTSFETGDDGHLEIGLTWPNPRFTDNQNGTITDNLTHLIWDKEANRFGPKTWSEAVTACNQLADGSPGAGLPGLPDGSVAGDWRLANIKELMSLIHYGFGVPDTSGTGQGSQGDPFNNMRLTHYWTSTTNAGQSHVAWVVALGNGVNNFLPKDNTNHVWCVRGGQ